MAGGAGPQRAGGIIEGINMTPLVDIMLVLLVIFIVTAKILVVPSVPLELPQATKTEDVQMIFAVTIPPSGATLVNGKPVVDDRELHSRAKEALAGDADLRAVIQADGAVPHRKVIAVLDALRRAGVVKVAFGTQPEPAEAAP
ncbi:MAG TPA: biopolymer transporter ExbD [Polyangia bacterium]